MQHRCEKTHLQWRQDRRSKVMRGFFLSLNLIDHFQWQLHLRLYIVLSGLFVFGTAICSFPPLFPELLVANSNVGIILTLLTTSNLKPLSDPTDLEECSIWNLSECRWRHMVGRRFSRYYLTSNLNWLWDSEIRDFRYSTKEDSCTHRK